MKDIVYVWIKKAKGSIFVEQGNRISLVCTKVESKNVLTDIKAKQWSDIKNGANQDGIKEELSVCQER